MNFPEERNAQQAKRRDFYLNNSTTITYDIMESRQATQVHVIGLLITEALMSLVNKLGWEVKRVTTWLANRKVKEKKSCEKEIGIPRPIPKASDSINTSPGVGNTSSCSREAGDCLEELEEQLEQLNSLLGNATELLSAWKASHEAHKQENESLKRENSFLRQEIAKFTRALKSEDSN